MIELIRQFFDTLLGFNLPDSVYQILGFALVSRLFSLFFLMVGAKDNKLWRFSTYVCIGVLALIAISDTVDLALTFGGI